MISKEIQIHDNQDHLSGALASSLPCSWTTPPGAGVEPGEHLTYKSAAIIHQVFQWYLKILREKDLELERYDRSEF